MATQYFNCTEPPCVLNVGGFSKKIPIPEHYSDWEHLILDIDDRGDADIICDARKLGSLPREQFDAVYCSHNLEHYYKHDVPLVLSGFLHVLKPRGFAEIRVPDLPTVFCKMLEEGLDLEDELYVSSAGPITIRDVIYGSAKLIENSGTDFMCHKTGFSRKSLGDALLAEGFTEVWIMPPVPYEIRMVAFRQIPTIEQKQLLGISS